jgi:hypothetical protein
LPNPRTRGKISRVEWPKIAARLRNGETFTEIARSYRCTAPAIRYIVGRLSDRDKNGHTDSDRREKFVVVPSQTEEPGTSGSPRRSYAARERNDLLTNSSTKDIWNRINTDITTFLAALDSLSLEDSDDNYQFLLAATDHLLWASARTRLELERILGDRARTVGARRVSG